MTRRRQFNERKLLKVYVDEADFQGIAQSATEASLSISEWARQRLVSVHHGDDSLLKRPESHSGSDPAPAEPRAKKSKVGKATCAHGVERSYRCWQCGGLAKVTA
jgi:hypothetical protein